MLHYTNPKARDGEPRMDESAASWSGSGRVICGYSLVECVGTGAFGRVHLARRLDSACDFALKEVPLTPLSDVSGVSATPAFAPPTAAAPPGQPPVRRPPPSRSSTPQPTAPQEQVANDICQEVRLLRQLDHPNVVQYYASFITGTGATSTLWIVMEFCGGVSLQSFTGSVKEKGMAQLPEDQTWQIFVQLCLALRYLHVEKGIAHRDLTPNNVLVQTHTLGVKVSERDKWGQR